MPESYSKFEVADDPGMSNVSGTSLKGTVKTSYAELEEVFGEPTIGPDDRGGDKTTCEWHIEFQVPVEAFFFYFIQGTVEKNVSLPRQCTP